MVHVVREGCAPRTYRQVLQKRAGMCQQCCSGENCNRDLCKNTGSSLTQPPPTVVSSIPVVAQTTVAATPRPTIGNQITTTVTSDPYNLGGCHYKGHVYAKGQTWDEGCSFRCTCEDDRTGRYVCQDICPTYVHMPTDCHLQKPPAGECCEKPVCQTSHITFTNVTTVNYTSPVLITKCLYKNQTYAQAAVWRDGCDYECTCVDASRGYYRCTSLCYSWNLPAECHLADPAPGKCCKTPECPLPQGDPIRVEVCLESGRLTFEQFRRTVGEGSGQDGAVSGAHDPSVKFNLLRAAEVPDLAVIIFGDEDVLRFEIQMSHFVLVCVGKRAGNLDCVFQASLAVDDLFRVVKDGM
ncbi:hypothetical protein MAR_038077 [Mya arenaria]|uniref:VWFC domain-containing protein n=1 Tax=Mya arenaria TaxID=6604 RepID=A0ABY7FQB2_MYAAR|nr:hypothetical protein MAR_038077 [Mya arenaria]